MVKVIYEFGVGRIIVIDKVDYGVGLVLGVRVG